VKPSKNKSLKSALLILLVSTTLASAQSWCWTNVAGSLSANGDADGTGDAARFSQLYGIDINGAGNLLVVCDRGASKIKTITLPGAVVTTVQSGFNLVQCVINKNNGNLYFPDISGAGTIYRLAPPYTGTPVPIANEVAYGLGIDSASDTLYVAGQNNNRIFYIPNAGSATPGALTLLAGSGMAGLVNGDLATAQFRNPMGMAVIVSGGNTNIYLADRANHAIRHINVASNEVTTVAGGSQGIQDGTGTAAQFSQPHNVVMGPDGNLYVCDQDNYTVRKVTLPDAVVTTIMGVNQNANNNGGATEGCGADALNGNLGQITIDSAGNIYTADRASAANSFAHVMKGTPPPPGTPPNITDIKFIFVAGGTEYCWTNFAGSLTSDGCADGTGSGATFSQLYGIDINGAGNTLFVADRSCNKIRAITVPGGAVTTVYNSAAGALVELVVNKVNGNIYFPDISDNTIKRLVPPYSASPVTIATGIVAFGLGIDSAADTLYVSGQDLGSIFSIANAGSATPGTLTPLAGDGTTTGFANGTLAEARFDSPMGIAVSGTGASAILYVADRDNHAIRKIDIAGNFVTNVAGHNGAGCADGDSATAQFEQPHGAFLGPDGNLYVPDQFNGTVRKVTLPAGDVTTIGGQCATWGAVDGCGSEALFGQLGQLTVDSAGNIYTADRAGVGSAHARVAKGTAPGGGQVVQIDFTGAATDTASAFTLQSSSNVGGTYGDVAATITELGAGSFQATIAPSGSRQFYRIRR
jgi:hypothetical protein